jgi:hypothetical protein
MVQVNLAADKLVSTKIQLKFNGIVRVTELLVQLNLGAQLIEHPTLLLTVPVHLNGSHDVTQPYKSHIDSMSCNALVV